jgi:hypothetical protein
LRLPVAIRECSPLSTPEFKERSVHTLHRISLWEGNSENSIISGRSLAAVTAQEIRTLANRITSDDVKVGTTSEILVPDAGWNDDHVSRFDVRTDPDRVAKANESMPSIDAQDFVRRTVVMRKRIDAIAPGGSPFVPGVKRFNQLGSLFSGRRDHPFINEQRQPRIVRYLAAIGKLMSFDLTHGCSRKIIETLLQNQAKMDSP